MDSGDRRQHIRFYFSLPMEFEVQMPDSPESWKSRARLKNISKGGLYFECEAPPELKRGSVVKFSFTTKPPKYAFINSPVQAEVMIKRIEPHVMGSGENFGIALQFLSELPFG
jgi:hypothetical protein